MERSNALSAADTHFASLLSTRRFGLEGSVQRSSLLFAKKVTNSAIGEKNWCIFRKIFGGEDQSSKQHEGCEGSVWCLKSFLTQQ